MKRKNYTSLLILLVLGFSVLLLSTLVFASNSPDEAQKEQILKKAYRVQVPFIENKGQVDSKEVRFYAKTFGGAIFVEKNGCLTYSLPTKDKKGIVIKEIFTDKAVKLEGLKPSPTRVNYFIGKDKNKWKTDIPTYGSISLGEIYKGIELKLKAYGNNVEKLFTVLPKENPEKIKIKVKGSKGLKVNEQGELEVKTELGSIKFTKPIAYQETGEKKNTVEVAYALYEGNVYGFKVGDYDKKQALIIDPLLASTFIGGSGEDDGLSIALDAGGNVYVAGWTSSSSYPTTPDGYNMSFNGGGTDVFVSKLDSSLHSLLASTFIGGNDYDWGDSIALDAGGNVYVTGGTYSSDYPTTPGAYDISYNGNGDVFVLKLDSALHSILGSTFIGGSGNDHGRSVALDISGNVYVYGETSSSDYPATPDSYDTSYNGTGDVFVSKLDSTLHSLLVSTFIGGSGSEFNWWGSSIVLDGSGNVYVIGETNSSDYPSTPGAYDTSYNGIGNGLPDVFVAKLDSTLSSLLASTFIGGSGNDYGNSIALDAGRNVYVTGSTTSSDYPTTVGSYDTSYNGNGDVFVSKLDSNLSSLLASTFIGGNHDDYGRSIALDGNGNVYVTGETYSSDYPTTVGSYDTSHNGIQEIFIAKLDSTLSSLLAGTFIGGSSFEESWSIALDASGNVYVTGNTSSSDYPTTPDAYDTSCNGIDDVFISKLDSNLSAISNNITLVLPNGGDVIPSGGIYGICWQSPLNAVKFDLQYSINNGTNWNFIKTVTGLNCTHWEEVPVVIANKKKCRVKVIGYDSNSTPVGEGISDKPFTIEVLRIMLPNGGENLTSGNKVTIQWTTHKTISPVAKTVLKYTTDGTTWKKIKTLTGNPGNYNWTVPSVSSTKCKVKVILKDANGASIGTDVSDKFFTIQKLYSCVSNSDCDEGEFCKKPVGQCGGGGVCTIRGGYCIQIADPVCGCDGVTYPNSACAYVAGVSVAYSGTCIP
jgi:hypothetical protein